LVKAFRGGATVGDIAIFGPVTSRLRLTLEMCIASLAQALEQMLYIANLINFLAVAPCSGPMAGIVPRTGRGEIELDNVTFTYPGAADPTLQQISLHVRPGEIIGIVGETGAGKTTLVKLLCRLYDLDMGCVRFDGIDVRDLSLDYLHSQIGFLMQGFGRYETTAAENIAYGDWQRLLEDREAVERIAQSANVDDLVQSLPQGYDTMLGRMFGTVDLSGGQWQRLALARAFARDASLMILDEPTSNLDARAEYRLFRQFRELANGRTTILISHRFSTLRMADRIVVLESGRLVECGTHQELLDRRGTYAGLYDLHRSQIDGGNGRTEMQLAHYKDQTG
jgi:ATP-binding cassette subfamily B protein